MADRRYGKKECKQVVVEKGTVVPFHNQVDFCVGTGRMGLALQKEYMEQLKLVQEHIGFKHIRGHGLFTDDMAIYQEREEDGERIVEYNFTYLDLVMDSYRELGLAPFLELGFMPNKMASGEQTIFYWKGNTTPPKSYEDWKAMVQALLRHLCERYGEEEVLTWPIEVWNEPNLPGFWKGADMQEYFKLFTESFYAIKEVNPKFRVGGPAVCGGTDEIWIKAFMEYCHENKIPVDFVTRHHYTTELPVDRGHYGYAQLQEDEAGFANLRTTRDIIDSFEEYKGLEIHITEFNTSYIPNCPIHDTNQNAAYLAKQLSRLGDGNESYSYWTFGDIFEERGVPFTPFHGGFGMVANGCIPKPTFWSFAFFKRLKELPGECVHRDDNCVIMKMENGEYRGVTWNRTNFRRGSNLELSLSLPAEDGEYSVVWERVDEDTCNPLKVWHDLGEPANPSKAQTALIRQAANPFLTSDIVTACGETLSLTVELPEHAVVYFTAKKRNFTPDRGYEYDYVMQQKTINPITRTDCPDPDVIRVEDTYYMVNTTMHFFPGCEILRSYDLMNWEHAAYVYDVLDSTPAQKLEGEENIYGKGMWAASLRYNKGTFYVVFVANDTKKTYLYTATDISGPWKKSNIEGFYHDCSLLFDDDDKVYIAYGNREIHITELKPDLSGPLEGGLDRIAVKDSDKALLGYEGTHFYKINGKYYLFFIHSGEEKWFRTESCFMADTIDGEFTGKVMVEDDRSYCGSGVAQGAIVDTPEGKWYAILFQDSGAVGRMPILMPVRWKDDFPKFMKYENGDFPTFGDGGKVPEFFKLKSTRPGYRYRPLMDSDDFKGGLKDCWQFNHEPELSLVKVDQSAGAVEITTDKVTDCVTKARNTLTQRMLYPGCAGEVTVDAKGLKEGDYAGLCVLQGSYGFLAVTRRDGELKLVMRTKPVALKGENSEEKEWAVASLSSDKVTLRLEADFSMMKDEAKFCFREENGDWVPFGVTHKMAFRLDHFTGARFGLFLYSTKESGGCAAFSDFKYKK